jgi:hypothetical protein
MSYTLASSEEQRRMKATFQTALKTLKDVGMIRPKRESKMYEALPIGRGASEAGFSPHEVCRTMILLLPKRLYVIASFRFTFSCTGSLGVA